MRETEAGSDESEMVIVHEACVFNKKTDMRSWKDRPQEVESKVHRKEEDTLRTTDA